MSDDLYPQPYLDAFREWASYALGRMDLNEWHVALGIETTAEEQAKEDGEEEVDCAAMIRSVYGRPIATIWLSKDWWTYEPDKQHHYLIHELCHLYSERINLHLTQGPLKTQMGITAWSFFYETYCREMEVMTDTFAYVAEKLLLSDETATVLWDAVVAASLTWDEPAEEPKRRTKK